MFDTQVNYLLKSPDNIEIVRDQLCGILALECDNQYQLACEAEDPVKEDYNIKIYMDHMEPWSIQSEDDKDVFPLVNVCLQDVTSERSNDNKSFFTYKATFTIDCYNTGLFNDDGCSGRSAVIKCWKTARIIRNILSAANYTYLGLRGIVQGRTIDSIETGFPNTNNSSINVCVCRIHFTVDFNEKSPQVEGPIIEPIKISISDNNNVVIME